MGLARRYIAVYGAFVRTAFLTMLAYRLRYFTGVFTYLLFVSVYYFIWQAVYAQHEPGALIHGFTLTQMITYVTIGWISRTAYFTDIDYEIDQLVKTGEMSMHLLRPVNFQLMMLAKALGQTIYRVSLFTLPVGLVILSIFPVLPPNSLADLMLFFLATFIGFFLLVEINFLVGISAFFLKSIRGLIRAKYFIVQLCSGLLLPLVFFPGWFRDVLELLPFKFIAYVPLQLYLGKITAEELKSVFLAQAVWVVLLLVLGRVFWQRALAKLTIQGG